MLKGFRAFILRGNVIELAVAVVVGTAFTAFVTAIVTAIITPAIGALFNAESLSTALVVTIPTVSGGSAELLFGTVLAAMITFVVVVAVVYFALVAPITHLNRRADERRAAGAPADESAVPTELELLAEIRDLLAKRDDATPAQEGGATTAR